MQHNISFPGLGLHLGEINRVAFTLFGRPVMWYGVIIAAAFLLAALYAMKRAPRFGLTEDLILDMLLFATPAAIVFARLYYVVFNFSLYKNDPAAIFRIWDGGIAVYGSIIGASIAALIFCKVRRVRPGAVFDAGALGLLIGQSIGRWGNFVNAEAYGTLTNLPWGMSIDGGPPVHPTFFYESAWNALGFVLLHFYSKKRRFRGEIFLLYVTWYGLGRGVVEGMRVDSLYFFFTGIRVSQVLGFASAAVGLLLLFFHYFIRRPDPAEVKALAYAPKVGPGGQADADAAAAEAPAPAGRDGKDEENEAPGGPENEARGDKEDM